MQDAGARCGGALGASDYNDVDTLHAQPSPSPNTSRNSPIAADETPTNNSRTDRPPRPMNAWLLFRTAQLRQMQEDDPGLRKSQGELSKIISEMWRGAEPEVKQHYEDLAKQRKLEHQRAYPDYRYSPAKTPGKASKPKRSVSSSSSRTARPSLRLSPSRFPSQATYEASSPGYAQQQTVGGALGAYDGPAGGDSSSTASSSHGSPAYPPLPTPSTAGWTHYADWSLPASASSTYEGQDNSAQPHFRHQHESMAAMPSTVHPAALQPYLMPASAPPTLTHFSSALGLTMSSHPSMTPSSRNSQAGGAHRSVALPRQATSSHQPISPASYAPPAHYFSPPSSAGLSASYSEPHDTPDTLRHPLTLHQPSSARPQDRSHSVHASQLGRPQLWAPQSYTQVPPRLLARGADGGIFQHGHQLTSPVTRGSAGAALSRSPDRLAYPPAVVNRQYSPMPPSPHRSLEDPSYDAATSLPHTIRTSPYPPTQSTQEYTQVLHDAPSTSFLGQPFDHGHHQYSQDPRYPLQYASHPHDPADSHIYPHPPPSA